MGLAPVLFGYIDPVSGVILLQLIIGGGIGCIARFRNTIWRFCSRRLASPRGTEELATVSSVVISGVRDEDKPAVSVAPVCDSLTADEREQRHEHRIAA
jgi:hypothetical protein